MHWVHEDQNWWIKDWERVGDVHLRSYYRIGIAGIIPFAKAYDDGSWELYFPPRKLHIQSKVGGMVAADRELQRLISDKETI